MTSYLHSVCHNITSRLSSLQYLDTLAVRITVLLTCFVSSVGLYEELIVSAVQER